MTQRGRDKSVPEFDCPAIYQTESSGITASAPPSTKMVWPVILRQLVSQHKMMQIKEVGTGRTSPASLNSAVLLPLEAY
jgi:hypothetical protein